MQSEQADGPTPQDEAANFGDARSTEVPPTEIRDAAASDWLPSRPPPLPSAAVPPQDLTQLEPGQRLGDFLICRVLGRGGFAAVYLALQWSLGREVALKVTLPQAGMNCSDSASPAAGEGQYLAQLDHPHIVRVYQQTIEPHTGAQLLCMQYVPGTTLERLIERLRERAGQWSGHDLLAAVEQETLTTTAGDPSPLPLRNVFVQADQLETVCRLGSQLATALEHAHRRGVVHRDIKPANVLVNRHGQPLLADFNLATSRAGAGGSGLIGGTLAYMSPEQLDAFRNKTPSNSVTADQLGDIYSLGVLLWQTTTGKLPFPVELPRGAAASGTERLTALLRFRRETPVAQWQGSEQLWPEPVPDDRIAPETATRSQTGRAGRTASQALLGTILAKAMHPLPHHRYRTARCFGSTLVGLAELHRARRASTAEGTLAAAARRYPVAALLLAGLIPQLIASLLQVTYNVSRVLAHFQPAQSAAFVQLVWWANPVIYGGCLAVFAGYLWRILPTWQRLQRADPTLTAREVDRVRNEALRLPRRAATIAGVGWLSGAIVFPAGVILLGGPLPGSVLLHFWMSFLLAGLISVTYSAFALATVVLRLFYLHCWLTPRHFCKRARVELRPLDQRLESITLLAGAIPLAAATALLFAGPRDEDDAATFGFRLLAVLLIVAGGMGFSMVGRVVGNLRKLMRGWTDGAGRETGV